MTDEQHNGNGNGSMALVASTAEQVWNARQLDIIKRHLAPGIGDGDLEYFAAICQRTGLDPFVKQIYTIGRNAQVNGQWTKKFTPQTSIDGYRLIAGRTGDYAGSDDPVFDTESESHPNKATVTVWKFVHGQRCPFTASARWAEYCPRDKDGNLKPSDKWRDMPYLMLGKCAESLALRKAFPFELSGVYTAEEMDQADITSATATVVPAGARIVDAGGASATASAAAPVAAIAIQHRLTALLKANGITGVAQANGWLRERLGHAGVDVRKLATGKSSITADEAMRLIKLLETGEVVTEADADENPDTADAVESDAYPAAAASADEYDLRGVPAGGMH